MSLKRQHTPVRGSARRVLSVGLLVLGIAGCATQAARPIGSSGAWGTTPALPPPSDPSPARTVLNVIATPLFLMLKAAVCATTAVIAVPSTAIAALSDPAGQGWQRQDLDDGVAANCGPPYVLY